MSKIASSGISKETLYVDVDDEITAIIDRLTDSKAKIVALVLPKRSTAMQSIVNMKLLKRASDSVGKKVVLITSEAALMPIAGLAGMYVSKTPTSRPEIPKEPTIEDDELDSIDEPNDTVADDDFDQRAVAAVSIGRLAANETESPIVMNDMADEQDEEAEESEKIVKQVKQYAQKPVDKKLKVPSFNKFRIGMFLGIFGILLLVTGWIFAANVLPKAGVAITTDGSTIATDLNLTLSTDLKTLDTDKQIVPAIAQTTAKTQTQEVAATGQLNNGKKSSGSMKVVATVCSNESPDTVPTGTAVTNSGNVYITQKEANFPLMPNDKAGKCWIYTSNSVGITALKAGAAYNTDENSSFTVKSSYVGSGFTSGGTDEIIKVLSQTDIDNAKSKLQMQDASEVKTILAEDLAKKGLLAAKSTFIPSEPQITTSANVGDKVESVKVTSTVQYTMLGVKEDYMNQLLMTELKDKINEKKQKILDSGLSKIDFSQENQGSSTSAVVTATIKTQVGPSIDAASLKKQIVGQKAADVKELINQTPGITEVEVAYSPFWVTRVPKNIDKITIIIDGKTY